MNSFFHFMEYTDNTNQIIYIYNSKPYNIQTPHPPPTHREKNAETEVSCYHVRIYTLFWLWFGAGRFHLGPLGLTLISAQISNYIHHIVLDEITYPFPNFNGATVEVWGWISNFIRHFTGQVITYPCRH